MRKKRKIPGITVGGALLPTPADFIRYSEEKKKRERKKSLDFFKQIIEKGLEERNRRTLEEAQQHMDIIASTPTESTPLRISGAYFPETDVYAQAGGGGGSGGYYTNLIPTTSNQPASSSGWWGQQPVPGGFEPSEGSVGITVQEKPISKKREFTADDWRGKFCALCTITFKEGIEQKGILFVKKCGHWKLLEFNGSKIAGGTAGSFETELKKGRMKIEVHKTLYNADYIEPVIGADELEIL